MAAPKKKRSDPGDIPAGNRGASSVAFRQQYHRNREPWVQSTAQADIINPDENDPQYPRPLQRGQPVPNASDTIPRGFQDWAVDRLAARQQSGQKGTTPVAQTRKKRGASVPKSAADGATYQPRMTDPVSGAKLQRGRPVAPANAAAGPDYTKLKTVQPGVQRAGPTGSFGPQYSPADYGRATANGDVMKKGQPVPPVYSGGLNDRIGLGLDTAGRALGMGFGPPAPAAPARRAPAAPRPSPTMATNPGAFGRAASMPPSRRAPAASDATIASVSKGMKNSPGYEDFPAPKKRKGY